jgi:hypothetical protein
VNKRLVRRLQRLRDGLILCPPRIDAPGRWIPPCTFVPTPVVTIAAGSGWAIYAPMAIPMAAPGGSFTAPRARATFPNITARSCMASQPRWSGSCASWPACRRGSAFGPPPGAWRSMRTQCCTGLSKPRSNCEPFPPIVSVTCTSSSYNSMSCIPSSVPSRMARSQRPRPSSACLVPRTGCG